MLPKVVLKEICVISANQLEVEDPARNRVLSIVEEFLQQDYKVHLISMDTDHYCLNLGDNFKHYKIPVIHTKIPSFFKRALLEIRIARNALFVANSIDVPVKLITIPSMFLLHLAFMLKIDKLAILDVRDLSWEYLSEKSIAYKVAKLLFRFAASVNFSKFGVVSVTNDKEYQYLSDANYKGKVIKVPNGISNDKFLALKNNMNNENADTISITYVGNIGIAQDLSNLIQVSKQFPEVRFNIAGSGTDFDRINKMLDQNQNNIHFLGRLNFSEILELYQNTDILYAQLVEDFSTAMPSKLYEYLSTGKYIIYAGGGVAKDILAEFDNVVVISPSDNSALAQAINNVIQQKDLKVISFKNQNLILRDFIRDFTVKRIVDEVNGYV
ncbi:MAG: glycosyltransferase [Acinetobacter venetianus]|uniref:glycosyltransferase n=1 Tax=Acinetobacter venetianus TaxID=52133 RepID=UPI003C78856B